MHKWNSCSQFGVCSLWDLPQRIDKDFFYIYRVQNFILKKMFFVSYWSGLFIWIIIIIIGMRTYLCRSSIRRWLIEQRQQLLELIWRRQKSSHYIQSDAQETGELLQYFFLFEPKSNWIEPEWRIIHSAYAPFCMHAFAISTGHSFIFLIFSFWNDNFR